MCIKLTLTSQHFLCLLYWLRFNLIDDYGTFYFFAYRGQWTISLAWLWTFFSITPSLTVRQHSTSQHTIKWRDKQLKVCFSLIAPNKLLYQVPWKIAAGITYIQFKLLLLSEGKHQEHIIWFSRLCSFHFSYSLCIIFKCICVMLI